MLTLKVDAHAWRHHTKTVCAETPGLLPVTKGNGYGFGNGLLSREAAGLGLESVAVGTVDEAITTAAVPGLSSVLVLTPWHAGDPIIAPEANIVRTVASVEGMRALRGERVVVECMTSLRRHGIGHEDLADVAALVDDVVLDGWALTMPIDRNGLDAARETIQWIERLRGGGLPVSTVFVSHLTTAEQDAVRHRFPGVCIRPRIGTALWLGDRASFHARAQVLDIVPVTRGDHFGYRQRRARSHGSVLVVSGGTANGVGLNAPKAVGGPISRAKALAIGALASLNWTRSPFHWHGRQLWFAEPPHMQVSLLWLPPAVEPPRSCDEIGVDVRMTTTLFDRVDFTELTVAANGCGARSALISPRSARPCRSGSLAKWRL